MPTCPNCGKEVSWLYKHDRTRREVTFTAHLPNWSCEKGDGE